MYNADKVSKDAYSVVKFLKRRFPNRWFLWTDTDIVEFLQKSPHSHYLKSPTTKSMFLEGIKWQKDLLLTRTLRKGVMLKRYASILADGNNKLESALKTTDTYVTVKNLSAGCRGANLIRC